MLAFFEKEMVEKHKWLTHEKYIERVLSELYSSEKACRLIIFQILFDKPQYA